MKIYLFNPVNGAYLGEDFANEDPFCRGAYIIPDDATTIPPPRVEPGYMQFFNVPEQRWVIHSIAAVRERLSRDTLDSNTPSEESP